MRKLKMDCTQAREWLLKADDTRPERCASAEVAEHLQDCAACRAFAGELTQIEQDWRNLPLPAAAETARQAFLARLPSGTGVNPAARQPGSRRSSRAARWAVAALVL